MVADTSSGNSIIVNSAKVAFGQQKIVSALTLRSFPCVEVTQVAASAGFGILLIDLEHSSLSLSTAHEVSSAALMTNSITPVVRVPANDSQWISRALDGGAHGVIVPHINSAAEAKNVVKYAKFQPLGERSATSSLPQFRYQAIPASVANPIANENTLVFVMVETSEAVERVEDIASVEGVDVVLIGSSDLTAAMGIPGEFDNQKYQNAVDEVSKACAKHGKVLGLGGIHTRLDLIAKFTKAPYNAKFIMATADLTLFQAGARAKAAEIKNLEESM